LGERKWRKIMEHLLPLSYAAGWYRVQYIVVIGEIGKAL